MAHAFYQTTAQFATSKRSRSLSYVAQNNNLHMCLAVGLFATFLCGKGVAQADIACVHSTGLTIICNVLVRRAQQNHRKLVCDYPSTELTPSD